MKRYLWIVALIAALAMVMAGCDNGSGGGGGGDGGEPEDLVEKVVFDLETDEGFQALTVKTLADSDFADDANPIAPLVRAAQDGKNNVFEIYNDSDTGKKAIKVTTNETWGVGFDLKYDKFSFRAGDVVTVKGKVVTKDEMVFLSTSAAGHLADAKFEETGAFTLTLTLTNTHVSNIKENDAKALRISGTKTGVVFQVNSIKIVGMRPSNLKKLATPVLAAATNGISWTAIENTSGFKVLVAEDGKDYDEDDAETLGSTATGYNMSALGDGTYKIKVTALGLADVSKDSDPAEIKITKVSPATTDKTISFSTLPTAIKGTVAAATDGYSFTYQTSGNDLNYGNAYAYFNVTGTAGSETFAKLLKVQFNYKGEAGDFNFKDIRLQVSESAFSGWADSEDYTVKTGDASAGVNLTIEIDHTKASAASLADKTNLNFAIIPWANNVADDGTTATKYTISNVKFVYGDPPTYTKVD